MSGILNLLKDQYSNSLSLSICDSQTVKFQPRGIPTVGNPWNSSIQEPVL